METTASSSSFQNAHVILNTESVVQQGLTKIHIRARLQDDISWLNYYRVFQKYIYALQCFVIFINACILNILQKA